MNKRHLFQNIKLKYQLFSLVAISMTIVLIVQIVYYHRFASVIKASSEVSTSNLLSQLEENLSIQADSIIQAANTIAYNEYVQQFMGSNNYVMRADYIKFIRNLFDYSMIANSNIYDIILVDDLGQMIDQAQEPDWQIIDHVLSTYPADVLEANGQGSFYLIDSDATSLYLYAFAFTSFRNQASKEVCYILFKNDSFQRIIDNIELPPSTSLFLVDQNNRILASKDTSLNGSYVSEEIQSLFTQSPEQKVTSFQHKKSLVQHSAISSMGWNMLSIVPVRELESPLAPLKTFGIVFGLIMLLLLLSICSITISNITRPLGELTVFLSEINYQTLKKRLVSTGSNEIDQVIQRINDMLEQIQELTHKIFTTQEQFYEMELAKKQAEFSALQNQINPHFLYNTLDCIRSIAFSYGAQEIVGISSSMSKIFRYCIKGPNTVLVEDELACVDNYITILQIRYDNRFLIEREIDPALYKLNMVKFILQPIIENAIYHGLELKLGGGSLKIIGKFTSEEDFCFEIFDTGVGISPEKLEEIKARLEDPSLVPQSDDQKHTGIGIYNINRRIKNIYGNSYGLDIESAEGQWTLVKVRLKALENTQER